MIILLKGEPKSTQHIYKATSRRGYASVYMTNEGKALKESYQWDAKMQWKGNAIITKPVIVSIWYYFKTKYRRDLENMNKLVLDALTGIVYKDDSQIDELHLYRRYDKKRPHIKIEITEI